MGIFAEILKIPPAQRVTLQVGPRPQHQAYPLGAGLLRDGRADLLQQFGIPAAGSGHLRGEAGGGAGLIYPQHIRAASPFLLAQAVGAVAQEQGRDAVFLICLGLPEALAGAKGDLVLQGHLL